MQRTLHSAGRAALLIVGIALALLIVVGAALLWTASDPGRAFIAAQVERLAPRSGLRVSIGRIEGHPLTRFTARDVVLSDPVGPFLTIPVLAVDWRPLEFRRDRLVVKSVEAERARLLRLPRLRPSDRPDEPLLPRFDIMLGRLRVGALAVAPAVAGVPATIGLSGTANIVAGRAVVRTHAASTLGDMLDLDVDALPDRDRLRLGARLVAPPDGLGARLAGLPRGATLAIDGAGGWRSWRGRLAADAGGVPLARLGLTATSGAFAARGTIVPAALTGPGAVAALTGPELAVDATVRSDGDRLRLGVSARSDAFTLALAGAVVRATERAEAVRFTARLLRPERVIKALRAGPIDVVGTMDGPLRTLALTATARTPLVAVQSYTLIEPRLAVTARLGAAPTAMVRLNAPTASGLPPETAALGQGLLIEAPLALVRGEVRAEPVTLRFGRASARVAARYVLATGSYAVGLDGTVPAFPLPGVGLADITAAVRLVSGPGSALAASGPVRARFTRLDNRTLARVAGGLPTVSGLMRLGGGATRVDALRLAAPRLMLSGAAALLPGGGIAARLTGKSADYGPVALVASGTTARPAFDLALARPDLGVGLANVRLQARPAGQGFALIGQGQTDYGPFSADVGLTLAGGPVLDVRGLRLAGVQARGRLALSGSVVVGTLSLAGQGVTGTVRLGGTGVQRADVELALAQARLEPLDPLLVVGRGRVVASVSLPESGPEGSAAVTVADVRRGTTRLTSGSLDGRYARGSGAARLQVTGRSGVPFQLAANGALAADRGTLTAGGRVGGQQVRLAAPAVVTRVGGSWVLAPATLLVADGRATLAGSYGAQRRANLALAGLRLDELAALGSLNLRGTVSGVIDATLPRSGLPTGSARLLVRNFARAGLAASSLPVEVEAAAAMRDGVAATRAFLRRQGRVLGVLQARVDQRAGGGLMGSPLSGVLRLQAPAEAVWPLAGIEALDLRGPIAVDATLSGRLDAPQVVGRVSARAARFESGATGTTITGLDLDGRFDGPVLTITRATGRAGDGNVSGTGRVSYTPAAGLVARIDGTLANALMLKTDTLRAAVTGPASIALDRSGGTIAGDVRIDSGRYQLGTKPAEQVPVLKVREIGAGPVNRITDAEAPTVWQVRLGATAQTRLNVRGLGLDSDWGADVRATGPVNAPRLVGRATLVRGSFDFSGRTFRLERGEVRFAGDYPPNPSVDIQATANVQGLSATLNITGSALRPQITFTSNPALPEDEVLSRLLFGSSVTDLSAPEALQLAAAVAQLRGGGNGGGGLNPINALRRVTGLDRLRVQGADKVTGRGTSVAAGKYIGRNVYLELATDARGYTATQIEVALTRWLSVLSSVASQGSNRVSVRVSRDY